MRDIIETPSHLVIAALRGNAGAGGAMMALASDRVFAREGVVLNPHYRGMGGLFGSEYWTYTLPRRVGARTSLRADRGPAHDQRASGQGPWVSGRLFR